MSFSQYLKDTRSELHHVAWPTRAQTIQYTILVVAVSVFISFYLGFFDFLFTTALSRGLQYVPQTTAVPQVTVTPVGASTSAPIIISTSTPTQAQ